MVVFPDPGQEPLALPRTHPGLRLLQSVRDEAHRFANGYHQLLRNRRIADSLLLDIPGLGQARCRQLLQQFGSVRAIARLTPEQLAEQARGVGPETARRICEFLAAHLV